MYLTQKTYGMGYVSTCIIKSLFMLRELSNTYNIIKNWTDFQRYTLTPEFHSGVVIAKGTNLKQIYDINE